MAEPNSNPDSLSDDQSSKSAQKKFDGLVTVRSKAINGKGAWYWSQLEPILVPGPPKSVKLRCHLCGSQFSASNPSRTASEHLKRGTCPSFALSTEPRPISSLSPLKRDGPSHPHTMVLSGGKDDLAPLAMLEDCVKRLKSPKATPCSLLSPTQADSAFDSLTDWVHQSCGSVSLSSLDHPKFRAFLSHVGLPSPPLREFLTTRLDAKFEQAKFESESKIRESMFFQVSSDGWGDEKGPVSLSVNLPNGTSVFRRAVFKSGTVQSEQAEEILWETVTEICGGALQRCVGIVADKYSSKALRHLENRHQWMVNLSCQHHGIRSLIKDFSKQIPSFAAVAQKCLKLANFVNGKSQVRNSFERYRLHEYGHATVLRVSPPDEFGSATSDMLDDVLTSARALQLVILDDSFKILCVEDPDAREISVMVRDSRFWHEVESVNSLVKFVTETARRVRTERPLIGQCLPIWDDIRTKINIICSKWQVDATSVEKLIQTRFNKNYHPAWAAAFVLDPLYLIKDPSGKYLPAFKCLTPDQDKDVDRLVRRLVLKDEAHVALMELMKWRAHGLDPVYARAVQMKERDPHTGNMRLMNPQSSRLVWEMYLTEFKSLGKVAVRLIFLHATSCGFKPNGSILKWVSGAWRSRVAVERCQKIVFIAAHAKMERQDFLCEEDRDAEILTELMNCENDVLNDVYVDTSPA